MPSLEKPAPGPSPSSKGPIPDGAAFAGMDRAEYPGDRVMASLLEKTNLVWTGFYLTPAPSQGHKLGWMEKHDFLRSLGWGLAPIYVGRQEKTIPRADHRMTPENGRIDGSHAAQLATKAGVALGSVIYLDFENGPPLSQKAQEYYAAWAEGLTTRGFKPGVYCLHGIAAGLSATVPEGVVWAVNYSKFPKKLFKPPYPQPDPALSGFPGAALWQLQGNIFIEYDDHQGGGKKKVFVDLNSSSVADPSGFSPRSVPPFPRVIPKF